MCSLFSIQLWNIQFRTLDSWIKNDRSTPHWINIMRSETNRLHCVGLKRESERETARETYHCEFIYWHITNHSAWKQKPTKNAHASVGCDQYSKTSQLVHRHSICLNVHLHMRRKRREETPKKQQIPKKNGKRETDFTTIFRNEFIKWKAVQSLHWPMNWNTHSINVCISQLAKC